MTWTETETLLRIERDGLAQTLRLDGEGPIAAEYRRSIRALELEAQANRLAPHQRRGRILRSMAERERLGLPPSRHLSELLASLPGWA